MMVKIIAHIAGPSDKRGTSRDSNLFGKNRDLKKSVGFISRSQLEQGFYCCLIVDNVKLTVVEVLRHFSYFTRER